jgi:hypothetical protein
MVMAVKCAGFGKENVEIVKHAHAGLHFLRKLRFFQFAKIFEVQQPFGRFLKNGLQSGVKTFAPHLKTFFLWEIKATFMFHTFSALRCAGLHLSSKYGEEKKTANFSDSVSERSLTRWPEAKMHAAPAPSDTVARREPAARRFPKCII